MLEHPNIRDTLNPATLDDRVRNVLEYCAQNQVRYVDKQFPPNQASLSGNPPHPEYQGQWNNLKWAKAEDIFGKGNYDVFRGIHPADIRQGSLGDCYFLCALSSLAEQPSLITRLFDLTQVNEYGVMGVWLHIDGQWRLYALDEYFPVNPGRGDLAFSRSVDNELWVIALEKAYAKAYGSYFDIVGGDPVHALRDLTGAPYDRIEDYSDLKAAWTKLKDSRSKGHILTCFTKQASVREQQGKEGLVSGHAYSILDVREVIDAYGAPRFIVKLRNPWGRFEWNGDFSDNSPAWIPQTKQELAVQKSEDGVFWMPFEEFIKYFEGIGILKTVAGYVSNDIAVKQQPNRNKSIVRMTVPKPGFITVSVDQTDSRTIDNPNYQYSYFRVTLAKVGGQEMELMDMVLSPERNIFLEKQLDAGDYVILIEAYWTTNLTNSFAVGTYGSTNVELQAVDSNDALYQATEYQIWKAYALRNRQSMQKVGSRQATDGYTQAQLDSYKFKHDKGGFTIYSYHNNSQTHAIHDSVKFHKLVGFDPVGRQTTRNDAEMLMNPGDNDILLFKMDPRQPSFSLSQQVVQEELIPSKVQPNTGSLEVMQKIGGTQITNKTPDPWIVSRDAQQKELERLAREKAAEEAARKRLIEEQARIAAENKRKQEEDLRRQGELYNRMNANRQERVQDRSGLSDLIGGVFGQFFAKDSSSYGYNQQQQFQYGQQQQYGGQQQQYGYNQNNQWAQQGGQRQNCAIF